MKNLLLLIIMSVAMFSISFAQQEKKLYTISDELIDVRFSKKFTQTDLDNVKKELAAMGIKLTYDFLDFDGSGHLKEINASIDYGNNMAVPMKSGKLKEGNNPGFYRDLVRYPIKK